MSALLHVTFQNGVFHPDEPVSFPEGAKLDFVAIPINAAKTRVSESDESVKRPIAPQFDSAEFRAIIKKHAIATGVALPEDFSREDIYRDDV